MTVVGPFLYLDAWVALERLLKAATWPASGMDRAKPLQVSGCTIATGAGSEWVLVETEPGDMSEAWSALGEGSTDEVILTDLIVGTELPWPTWTAAGARLKALTAVVDQTLAANSRPNTPTELNGVLVSWQVVRIRPQIAVSADKTFAAGARLTVQIKCRRRPV